MFLRRLNTFIAVVGVGGGTYAGTPAWCPLRLQAFPLLHRHTGVGHDACVCVHVSCGTSFQPPCSSVCVVGGTEMDIIHDRCHVDFYEKDLFGNNEVIDGPPVVASPRRSSLPFTPFLFRDARDERQSHWVGHEGQDPGEENGGEGETRSEESCSCCVRIPLG